MSQHFGTFFSVKKIQEKQFSRKRLCDGEQPAGFIVSAWSCPVRKIKNVCNDWAVLTLVRSTGFIVMEIYNVSLRDASRGQSINVNALPVRPTVIIQKYIGMGFRQGKYRNIQFV